MSAEIQDAPWTAEELQVVELAEAMERSIARATELSKRELEAALRHDWWADTLQVVTQRVLHRSARAAERLGLALSAVLRERPLAIAALIPKQRRIYQLVAARRADLVFMLPDVPGGTSKRVAPGPAGLQAAYDLTELVVKSSAPEQLVLTIFQAHLLDPLVEAAQDGDEEHFGGLAAVAGRYADRFTPYLLHAPFWPWAGSLTAALEHSIGAARTMVRLGHLTSFSLDRGPRNRYAVRAATRWSDADPTVHTVFLGESSLVEHVVEASPLSEDGVAVPRAVTTGKGTFAVQARLLVPGTADVPLPRAATTSADAEGRLRMVDRRPDLALRSGRPAAGRHGRPGVRRPAIDE